MIFQKMSHLKMSKVPNDAKFSVAQMDKLSVLIGFKWTKIHPRKTEKQKNPVISTLCILNKAVQVCTNDWNRL